MTSNGAKDPREPVTHKTHLTLERQEWQRLAAAAYRRKITGRRLIEELLSRYGVAQDDDDGEVSWSTVAEDA